MENSSILLKQNPYAYLNEKNAIILNCKDPKFFTEVYEKAVEKHFLRELKDKPVLHLVSRDQTKLGESMGKY